MRFELKKHWWLVLLFLGLVFGLDLIYHLKTGKVRTDFKYHYLATQTLLKGGDIYDAARGGLKFKYFPVNAVLFTVFAVWPVHIAQSLWLTFNVGLALVVFYMLYQLLSPLSAKGWLIATTLFAGLLWTNLKLGQVNFPVFCFTVIGLYFFIRRRDFISGSFIGLAAVLKFMPIFFGIYFLWKRQWRVIYGLLSAMLLLLVILPVIAMGPTYYSRMMQRYLEEGSARVNSMSGSQTVYGQSIQVLTYALMHRVDKTTAFRQGPVYINLTELGHKKAKAIALALSAFWIGLALWVTRGRTPRSNHLSWLWEFCILFCLMLIVSPEARGAHFLTLYFPYSLLLSLALPRQRLDSLPRRSLLAVLTGGYFLLSLEHKAFGGEHLSTLALGYSVMGLAALILFIYLIINHRRVSQMDEVLL